MIDVLVAVAVGGMFVLFGLAALAGITDGRSQHSAWSRIAVARRELHEVRQKLGERELRLDDQEEHLDARARQLLASERVLDERARALDLREQELSARERGPGAA